MRSGLVRKIFGTLPSGAQAWLRRGRQRAAALRYSAMRVRHRSPLTNLYHCCVHKTASQWLRRILADPDIYRYSGLRPFQYQSELLSGYDSRRLHERTFDRAFPPRTIISPLYIDYEGFARIAADTPARAFFVARDPRDILISWYYSTMGSHGSMVEVMPIRRELRERDRHDGLLYLIDHLADFHIFDALRSWSDRAPDDPRARVFRYEDLTGPDSRRHFRDLFEHLEIALPESRLPGLLDRHSFERLSGRSRGQEDRGSHYRRGVPGDWKDHFDPEIDAKFRSMAGDLVEHLGYADEAEMGSDAHAPS